MKKITRKQFMQTITSAAFAFAATSLPTAYAADTSAATLSKDATVSWGDSMNGFEEIECSYTDYGVIVYQNAITNQNCAIFDLSDFSPGDNIVLYSDENTGAVVEIAYIDYTPSIELLDLGDSGWTSGTIPSGTSVLKPSISSVSFNASFYINVSAYPVVYGNPYNKEIGSYVSTLASSSLSLVTAQAGSSPATASLEFTLIIEEVGIVTGSFAGYLTVQTNSNGQCRTMWSY